MSSSRFRPRLSLRGLLFAITVAALALGYVMQRARSQAAAVGALGPELVVWDFQVPDGDLSKWDPSAAAPGPSWLQPDGKPGLFSRVVGVILVKQRVKQEMAQLAALPGLLTLNLGGSDVDDAALAHVAPLVKLQSLNLDGTPVGDAGLVPLAGLHDLEALWLNDTKVTDAGLPHLAGLKKLRRLYLEGTTVTDAGVAKFKTSLPECEVWWGPTSSPQSAPLPSAPSR